MDIPVDLPDLSNIPTQSMAPPVLVSVRDSIPNPTDVPVPDTLKGGISPGIPDPVEPSIPVTIGDPTKPAPMVIDPVNPFKEKKKDKNPQKP